VLAVEDHPALLARLEHLLDQEPGSDIVGPVATEKELTTALGRGRPDVVILGYALGQGDR